MISSVAVEGIWMWDVARSGKVERLLALASRNQQFLSHGLYAGVVRQLQVVDTGHDWGEEVIRVLCRLECLPHNRQRRIQAAETSDRQSGAPCDKLQEESLLLGIEAAQHLKQETYGATVVCVAVVRSTALHQCLDVPRLWFTATQQLVKLQQEKRDNEQRDTNNTAAIS